MSCSLSRSSLRLVSSMRSCWLARVFTCTGLYSPTRIICAIPRASLRSLLFTCWAFSTAFMWRVSTQITGSPASANPFTSHCDSGPASSPIRAYSSPALFKKAMMASGSVATLVSRTTFPASSTMQIAVSLTDTSRPTECFMAVLPLSTFEAGLPGPRFQRQCEELPLPPPANSAGTAISGCGLHRVDTRVQHRPVPGTKRAQRRRRGQQRVALRYFHRPVIAARRPTERSAMRHSVGLARGCDHGAVGQFVRTSRYRMHTLAPVIEPFRVQDCVDLRGPRHPCRAAGRPCIAKGFCGVSTAEETRAVSRRERDRLVKKEQLRPTAGTHNRPAASLEFAETNEPGLTCPAPVQQRPGCRVMNDPAIASEHASLRYRNDFTERRHPVLQRHRTGFRPSAERCRASDRSAGGG